MPTTCEKTLRERYEREGFAPGSPLDNEARFATMFLRDWVADWADQSDAGRAEAVVVWKELRRQRAVLRRLFGEECP